MMRSLINIFKAASSDMHRNSQIYMYIQRSFRHSKAHANVLQPLKVTSSLPSRTRRSQVSSERQQRRSNHQNEKVVYTLEDEDTETMLDELANTISKYSSKMNLQSADREFEREMIRESRKVRAKTIEHKFFKKPQPPSVLTYSAKEQIRLLHRRDPDVWSISVLAETFPVSAASIKKILKSKVHIHRERDILSHDLLVQKTWKSIKASLEGKPDEEFDKDFLKSFKNSEGENLVTNAAGIKNLPLPAQGKGYNPKGPFSSIVRDCFDIKEQNRQKEKAKLNEASDDLTEILEDVSNLFREEFGGETFTLSDDLIPDDMEPTHHSELLVAGKQIEYNKYDQQSNLKSDDHKYVKHKYNADNDFGPYNNEHIMRVKEKIPDSLELQHTPHKKSDTFVKGDCVYDENGEFLYRIP